MSHGSGSAFAVVRRLFGYARPYVGLILVTVTFSFLYSGGIVGRMGLLVPLFDDVVAPKVSLDLLSTAARAPEGTDEAAERRKLTARVEESFFDLAKLALALILFIPLVRLVRDYAGEWIMTRLLVDMQQDLGAKLLRLPLSRHHRDASGDVVSRMSSDTVVANHAQALVFGEAVQDLATIAMVVVALFYLSWQLALVTLLAAPPIGVALASFGRRIREASRRRQIQNSEVIQQITRILSGIKVIKAFDAEDAERAALHSEQQRYFRRAIQVVRNRVYSRSIVEFVQNMAFVALIFLAIGAYLRGAWGLTFGTLGAFLGIAALPYHSIKNLTRLYNAIQDAIPAAQRVFETLDLEEEPEDAADAVSLDRIRRGIRYRKVGFSYGREPVLENVDLEIRAGELVALVGHSGAGKTTLADLLLRFYDPQEGAVEIDGIDLRRIRRDSLRRLISVVTQESFLFDATIFENIRYGRPDAKRDEVVDAARAANAAGFIEALPDGYETEVGELGSQLSGGQRQRIAIARAILRDPQVLIFDEATSALDARAEYEVQAAIANLLRGRTVLTIAHRLSTVKSADRIAVLEQGRICEMGTHGELIARGGRYRELVELQLLEPRRLE